MPRATPRWKPDRPGAADRGQTPPLEHEGRRPLWPCGLLILAGLLAYANSYKGAFLFDDFRAITYNESIRKLWPLINVLSPPFNSPVGGRPLLNLTFAINYALGGLRPWGYHAVNVAIHLAAGLLLWGVLRRLWPLAVVEATTHREAAAGESSDNRATWLATVVSVIWIVHPLQTESVTYVVQRAEALVGLFYLLTVYCAIRGMQAMGRAAARCLVAAVAACGLGMATKENMATAPLVVLLLDWAFFSKSVRAAMHLRWRLYAGLAGTWLILGALMAHGPRSQSAGFHIAGMGVWDYAASEPLVILHYLRLALWPHPLCLDYAWPVVRAWPAIVIPALVLSAAVVASIWAFRRGRALGVVGVCFFVTLAPTSSVIPLKDLAFEHRMYLPLAAVVVAVVELGGRLIEVLGNVCSVPALQRQWMKGLVVVVIVGVLSGLTVRRNTQYQDPVGMWQDVATKRPDNVRAYVSLGVTLGEAGRHEEALRAYSQALQLDPGEKEAQANMGRALAKLERYDDAVAAYEKAVSLSPDDTTVRYNLGIAWEGAGRIDKAIECYKRVLQDNPDHLLARLSMGVCLEQSGDLAGAIEAYRGVLAAKPGNVEVRCNVASCLARMGKLDESAAECRRALEIGPASVLGWQILGDVMLKMGRLREALDAYRHVVKLDPTSADARCTMGRILGRLGRLEDAIACHQETLRKWPRHVMSRFELATLLKQQGRLDEAAEQYSEILRIEPDHAAARAALDELSAQRRPGGR